MDARRDAFPQSRRGFFVWRGGGGRGSVWETVDDDLRLETSADRFDRDGEPESDDTADELEQGVHPDVDASAEARQVFDDAWSKKGQKGAKGVVD